MRSAMHTAASRPITIDLYAGAGGLSLGMEQAGFDVVAAVELDPIHALTHRFNFPRTPVLCGDVGTIDAAELTSVAQVGWEALGNFGPVEIDAVVGGPPCQGFSVGGVRDSDDERNSQLLRFISLVAQLKPKVFLLENVAGLLEPRFDGLRKEAFAVLERAGYSLGGIDKTVNASNFGVPQSRRRVLIMGSLEGFLVPELQSGTMQPTTVGDALSGLPDLAAYRTLLAVDEVSLRDEDFNALIGASSVYARRLVGVAETSEDRSFARVHDPRLLTGSLRTVHTPKTVQRFARTIEGTVERVSRLYRLAEDGVSRTLRAGTGTDRGSHTSPRPIHPTKSRVITVREAARLHGYPDWFRFHATNWHGHRQVGNSVPPPLAAAAGRALVKALGYAPVAPSTAPLPLGDPDWVWQNRTEALATLATLEPRSGVARAS